MFNIDIEQLKQYNYLIMEANLMDMQIKDINTGVQIGNDETVGILLQRKSDCLAAIQNIENWIVSIPDKLVQEYIIMFCLDNLKFSEIAQRKRAKTDTVKKCMYRYIKQCDNKMLHNI